MNTVKIIAPLAIAFVIGLIITCCLAEHPLEKQYEDTLQIIMKKEQFDSESSALNAIPELLEIRHQINEIKAFKANLSDFGRGKPMSQQEMTQSELNKKITSLKETQEEILQKLFTLRRGA